MFTKQSECLCSAAARSALTRNEKDVFNYLVKCADDTGKSWPSVGTITAEIGICEGTYKKAIKALIGMGLVRREFRFNKITGQQRSNYFFISLEVLLIKGKDAIINFINNLKSNYLRRLKDRQDKQAALTVAAEKSHESQRDNCAQKRRLTAINTVKNILGCIFGKKASYAVNSVQNHVSLYINKSTAFKDQLFSGFFRGRGHGMTPEIKTYSSLKRKNTNL